MAISQVLYWLKPSFWLVCELSLDWLERIYRPLSCQALCHLKITGPSIS